MFAAIFRRLKRTIRPTRRRRRIELKPFDLTAHGGISWSLKNPRPGEADADLMASVERDIDLGLAIEMNRGTL